MQLAKAYWPIVVKVSGSVREVRVEHRENTPASTLFTAQGSVREVRLTHTANASIPILVRVSGSAREVTLVHP